MNRDRLNKFCLQQTNFAWLDISAFSIEHSSSGGKCGSAPANATLVTWQRHSVHAFMWPATCSMGCWMLVSAATIAGGPPALFAMLRVSCRAILCDSHFTRLAAILRSPSTSLSRRSMSRRGAQAPPGPPPLLPPPPLLGAMQAQLAALADPAVASGQNAYFKDVIKHRGIKTPALDAACKAFLRELSAATEPTAIRQLGLALLREPLQEDKLAGMNLLAHWLLRCGGAAGWHEELAEVEGVYTAGHVFAW